MSDMKCPFCQQELDTSNCYTRCHNPHCNITTEMEGTEEIWNALVRTRKALDVAIERLNLMSRETFQGEPSSINMGFHVRAEAALADIDEITALEQKDVK